MKKFLYMFGYEGPWELVSNQETGSDYESCEAVWITADSEEEALAAGQQYAESFVRSVFEKENEQYGGWNPSTYANWIEYEPLSRFSGMALESLPEIDARGT